MFDVDRLQECIANDAGIRRFPGPDLHLRDALGIIDGRGPNRELHMLILISSPV